MNDELKSIRVSDLEKIDKVVVVVSDMNNLLIKHLTESEAIRDCVKKLDADINGNGKMGLKEEFHRFKWIAIGSGATIGIVWTVATFVIPFLRKVG